LNDSAFNFEPENSVALGFASAAVPGLLHLEIVQDGWSANSPST